MDSVKLTQFDKARNALAKAATVDEVKEIRDKAEAIRAYLKQSGESLEMQNQAASIKLRAERRGGELLRDMEKNPGGGDRKSNHRLQGATSDTPTLADIGIEKTQSHRWQQLASIDEDEFEGFIAESQAEGKELTTAGALRIARKNDVRDTLDGIKAKESEPASGEYDVLVIDPPWPMTKIDRDCRPNQVEFDYPTMTEEELAELVVPTADNAHVWLWTTHKFLPMALRLLVKWELKYVCSFVWHKPGGFQPVGLPQYNCEFALYARKGSPVFADTKNLPLCFEAKRGKHSEKPEEFYDMVRRVTVGHRLDMFNRRAIEGFDGWGNESQ